MTNKKYPIADRLQEDYSRHCSTLAITETFTKGSNGILQIAHPDEKSRNGTLTFVKSDGKTFAITCWHVIEHFRELKEKSGDEISHSLFTMTPRPYTVVDTFIRPSSQFESHKLDIAIRQVRNDYVPALGKEAIDLDNLKMPEEIEFGFAVGFPEDLKYEKEKDAFGSKRIISLPTVAILAEINEKPDQRFTMFSEFESPQGYETYSGMSGGPIFWSTEKEYGIYGIMYEANPSEFTYPGMSIMLAGELATPEIIKGWINQIPELIE